jgi:hypothetical protein
MIEKNMTIDYTALNERIVKQAYDTLSQEQVKQLVEDKIARALALREAQEVNARGSKYTPCR